jgi:hypothetical protein
VKLHGSCHCGNVRFDVESAHPYPFNLCYCSICRKTAGGGGYAINLGADFETMQVEGREHVRVYRASIRDERAGKIRLSPAERSFCGNCGSALWVWDPRWSDLVHPFASAVDTELPVPPERTHLMLSSKANWVPVENRDGDKCFAEYPDESIAAWHARHNI